MANEIRFSELANLQPKQDEALQIIKSPECKYFLYGGAAGGGKSYLLRWAALNLGLYYFAKYGIRNVPIGLFSEDYPTLKDRQVSKIKREFPSYLGTIKDTTDEGLAFYLHEKYGGARIMLRNLDDPSKYASVEFAAIGVEELTKNKRETFDDLRSRLRFPGIKDVKFFSATNPGEIGHVWVKKLFITKPEEQRDIEADRFFFLHADVYDNKYIDSDYRIQLDSLPERKRQALLYGNWDIFDGQFFEEWSAAQHVIEPHYQLKDAPDNFKYILGWDEGTTNPRAVNLLAQDNDGKVEVIWEYYRTNETASVAATNIRNEFVRLEILELLQKRGKLVYDPSMDIKSNQTGVATSQVVKNILGMHAERGNNNRIEGARRFREFLRWSDTEEPYLRVWSTCFNFIETLPALVYADNGKEDINTKGVDHAYDDVRYALMSLTMLPDRLKAPRVKYQDALGYESIVVLKDDISKEFKK